jgi:hypothetical protein
MYITPKSGLLLISSCVAAIAAVGSVFELSSGTPQLGQGLTTFILVMAIPLTILCFYGAIRVAKADQ